MLVYRVFFSSFCLTALFNQFKGCFPYMLKIIALFSPLKTPCSVTSELETRCKRGLFPLKKIVLHTMLEVFTIGISPSARNLFSISSQFRSLSLNNILQTRSTTFIFKIETVLNVPFPWRSKDLWCKENRPWKDKCWILCLKCRQLLQYCH